MGHVVDELKAIVAACDPRTADAAELSRTLAWTGSAYFDLGRGVDEQCLQLSSDCYVQAERVLGSVEAPLARAKLDFNFANTLRGRSRGTDVALLEAAEQRYERAARVFARLGESAFAAQAREYLDVLRSQLSLARHAAQVASGSAQLDALREQLAAGTLDAETVGARMQELKGHLSHARVEAALEQAMADANRIHEQHPERFTREAPRPSDLGAAADNLRSVLGQVTASPTAPGVDDLGRGAMDALRERLQREALAGNVDGERAQQLGRLLEQFGEAMSSRDDIGSLSASVAAMKEITDRAGDFALDASYGGALNEGTRAEEVAHLISHLKRFLIAAAIQSSDQRMIKLMERQADLERQLRSQPSLLPAIERDCWRLASDLHGLSRSRHLTLATPIWETRRIRHMPQSVFVSGGSWASILGPVAGERGWTLLGEPESGVYETERWNQLCGASVAVFCLPSVQDVQDSRGHAVGHLTARQERAQVCYELGIALALGLPVVVGLPADTLAPFDVPVETLRLRGNDADAPRLAQAIERAVFSLMWGAASELREPPPLYQHARVRFSTDSLEGAERIAWRVVSDSKEDPFTFRVNLERFIEMASKEKLQLLNPAWLPRQARSKRCFHVTAFRGWSRRTSDAARRACEHHHVEYRHGEHSDEQRIIEAIWSELTESSCVLADLTDLNPNAALELGIAHTLGKPTRVLFNGRPEELFPSVRKERISIYSDQDTESCIEQQIASLAALE